MKQKVFDVVSLGAATRDVFLRSKAIRVVRDDNFSTGEAECFALGAKLEVDEIVFETGGGGTNSAVSFARQGLRSSFFGRIGKDARGQEIIQALKREGVDTSQVIIDLKRPTGYSVLLLTPRGERTVLVYRGASADFLPSEVDRRFLAKWLYISSLGGNKRVLEMIWKRAHEQQIQIAWNPGAKELALGINVLAPLMKQAAVFTVNQEEAATLLKFTRHQDQAVFHKLRSYVGGITLLTQGTDGCFAAQGQDVWHSGTHSVKVVDTTGAGDAFGSGFVGSYIRHHDIPRALQEATENSESVIQYDGAKTGLRRAKKILHPVPVTKL